MKTLVVEDSRLDRELIATVLGDLGVEAHCVETGAEGLAALERERFGLVCLDLHLPDVDGLEICRRLRQSPATRMVPVILLTSDDCPEVRRAGFDAGITELLIKSAGLAELHASIKHFVARLEQTVTGRVLYVEDSPTTARLTLHLLQSMHVEVVHHVRAEEALAAFEAEAFDLVITDVVLEGDMSGLGLVRAIRGRTDDRGRVPVLAISGFDDPARRVELLRCGANDYVPKPILEEELAARVTNLIETKQLFDRVAAQQRELERLAETDQLTGLYNRRYLARMSDQHLAAARRHREPLSVVVLDLDHFKRINDDHGHAHGDLVLAELGRLLRDAVRRGDVCARTGGEEFMIVLPRCPLDDALAKAEGLRRRIEALLPGGTRVTASFGVAALDPASADGFDDLYARADRATYAAKAAGRNRVASEAEAGEGTTDPVAVAKALAL